VNFFDGGRYRHNFLNRFPPDKRSDESGAGAGEEYAVLLGSKLVLGFQAV
jgi:hypothetical protein